jgi:hypothetical protein
MSVNWASDSNSFCFKYLRIYALLLEMRSLDVLA